MGNAAEGLRRIACRGGGKTLLFVGYNIHGIDPTNEDYQSGSVNKKGGAHVSLGRAGPGAEAGVAAGEGEGVAAGKGEGVAAGEGDGTGAGSGEGMGAGSGEGMGAGSGDGMGAGSGDSSEEDGVGQGYFDLR